ncbi:MAG: SAM-dependent methyltransferase [Microbacteriaceae bacterium]|nr:SAM-dependent methyltransferase [Microbacteriaceae bacterium]
MTELLESLRRWPDTEAAGLRAWDAADTLILDEAAPLLPGADVAVIGDSYGALALGALAAGALSVRVHQDSLLAERALTANAGDSASFSSLALGPSLVSGATLVLLRLPLSLDALEEQAALIAASADPSVVVIAGGRIKHMSLGMNEVLARHFSRIDVSLARQKSRLLTARAPIAGVPVVERRVMLDDVGLWVAARGGVFAGTKLDIGTRFLLSVLPTAVVDAATAIDFGCGSGIVAASLAMGRPGIRVVATDLSAAAVASAAATMAANGLADRVEVVRDIGLESQTDASADLVALNPPFHLDGAVHTGLAESMFVDAARVLRPGGELWTVFNSHLAYRPALQRIVGPTREVARNAKFTVTASRKAPLR